MLVRLLYASRVNGELPCDQIHSIMQQSHANNPRQGITGILCHTDHVFMQVLEGGREKVNALYAAILRDPRHADVMLLTYEEIDERKYAGWTMGQVNLAKVNPSILLRFSDMPGLDPYALPGRSVLALIDELVAAAAIIGRS
ncbi:MAG: BLUF domain-containing protein [Gammaproteobacteria bacterium]